MYKIYHNPRCKKSKDGLDYLSSKTNDFEIVNYLKNGLSIDEIKELLLKLHISPKELIRVNEEYYKKELKAKQFNDEEWIQIISENPKLLRRPLIVGKYKAVIGDPTINIEKLL